ncbi:ethylene-insensitive protein 2.2 isoform X2 [Daucus carota subsp. sativus]|uniref:ethylene-insensitive protein 2.2 isoform X2 n=1 Tax=Daucus carota subsp. sativus TaxID=79200 RepID=UPI0007F00E81|nr:PREDICTED: ethylene-insensitive protein 2 isoform X2 [Daucus carota subsp. sativus]
MIFLPFLFLISLLKKGHAQPLPTICTVNTEESILNMDETMTVNHQLSIFRRLLSAVVPMLLVAMSYIDPGKWAAAVEGGARYESNIVLLILVFNLAAILCQYLSARIAVVTDKDLAQICSEEYGKVTCIVLGLQSELSMIVLDLTMILGTAHGLNLISGVDLFTCVFLTAMDALLFPVFSSFSEQKAKFLCIYTGAFMLFSYIFGTLISQSGIPVSMGGTLINLSGDSSPAFMSLLGASVMPHNFYLHSSLVKQEKGGRCISKTAQFQDHLFSIICIFSGIFLVNYVLVNSAANAFYSTNLSLTFNDVLPLSDQGFRDLVLAFVLVLILIFCNHITALSWKLGRQAVLHSFFKAPFPGWIHHSVIRVLAIVPALYCVWNSGAEGIYQLLLFSQIVIALMLPSSVIPLFRVATSSSVMGVHKISQPVEFLVFSTFVGMLGIEIVFVAELIFGNSEWVINLQWNMWSETSVLYVLLLITACLSLCLVLWLAVNPLSSSSSRVDAEAFKLDVQSPVPGNSKERSHSDIYNDREYQADKLNQEQEFILDSDRTDLLVSASSSAQTSESLMNLYSSSSPQLTTVKENSSDGTHATASVCIVKDAVTTDDILPQSIAPENISSGEAADAITFTPELSDFLVKTSSVEVDSQTHKSVGGDTLEPKESSKLVSGSCPSVTSEGPGSYRSLGGKADDVGSGAGSISRLAGLGRASRRQLAVVLDEFWGQLFDFHGKATVEAKAKKLDTLLGVDSKVDLKQSFALPKVENNRNEFSGNVPSPRARISNSFTNSSLFESPVLQSGQRNVSYGVQRESLSLWSSNTQLLDTYMHNSVNNAVDSSERRYSSMRLPPSTDVYNDQPATVHGYHMAYLSRIAKEKNAVSLSGQMELPAPKSPSLAYRDPFVVGAAQKPRIGASAKTPPGFPSIPVSRTSTLQPGRQFQGILPGVSADVRSAVDEKKYHSLPSISGLSLPYRKSLASDMGVPIDNPAIYRQSMGRSMQEASLYPNPLSMGNISALSNIGGAPASFDNFHSKVGRDTYSLQFNSGLQTESLWSRQPFEQFGVSGKAPPIEGEGTRTVEDSITQETPSVVVFEAKLLQSFRICIQKLLKLEGSDWLFRQNDGADEELIDRVGARERFLYEAENQMGQMGESHFPVDRKPGFQPKNEEMATVPLCGEGCIWRVDLIISFGVWCVHRILELSLMESRPELWGKYTYVLNRLQGIIDIAFSKPRTAMTPCLCLQIPPTHQRSPSPISYGSLPPPAKHAKGKSTTPAMLLEMVKDVEIAISCRKGRTGTAAGDVAFPKGKENLASVLKRYKRRLTSKPMLSHDNGPG